MSPSPVITPSLKTHTMFYADDSDKAAQELFSRQMEMSLTQVGCFGCMNNMNVSSEKYLHVNMLKHILKLY